MSEHLDGSIVSRYHAHVLNCDCEVAITVASTVAAVLSPEDLNLIAYRAITFIRDEIRILDKERKK